MGFNMSNTIEVTSVINALSEYGANSYARLKKEETSLNTKSLSIGEKFVKILKKLFGQSYNCSGFNKDDLKSVADHVITHLTPEALTYQTESNRKGYEFRDLINTSKAITKLLKKTKTLSADQKSKLIAIIAHVNSITTTYFEKTPEQSSATTTPPPSPRPIEEHNTPTPDDRVTLDPKSLRTFKIKSALGMNYKGIDYDSIKL